MLTIQDLKEKIDLDQFKSPVLFMSKDIIRDKVKQVQAIMPGLEVYYATKPNPHPEILKTIVEQGAGLEVASLNEFKKALDIGVPIEKIISSHPLKPIEFIKFAYEKGLKTFVFDSTSELDKIAEYAPGSKVVLRLSVDNTGADWSLSEKFGVRSSQALELFEYARGKGLESYGLTFHVGSQCLDVNNWGNALIICKEVLDILKKNGMELGLINLGGGIPSKYVKEIPSVDQIKENINKTIKDVFNDHYPNLKFQIEPGRGFVGEAGIIMSNVIALAKRGVENWLILDVGVYNGLFDAIVDFEYEIVSEKELNNLVQKEEMVPFAIAGPTCDSIDIIAKEYEMPKNTQVGDKVFVLSAGAYTTAIATKFNNFDPPETVFI